MHLQFNGFFLEKYLQHDVLELKEMAIVAGKPGMEVLMMINIDHWQSKTVFGWQIEANNDGFRINILSILV